MGICGVICTALGILVLAGWHTGNTTLVRLRPNLAPMQYLTAIWFLLSGIGLTGVAFRFHRAVTAVCGGLVALVSLMICLEYIFQGRWVSSLLVPYFPSVSGIAAGRPAAPAVTAFALCGVNLLLLGLPVSVTVRRVFTWILGSPALALALVALSGDLLGFAGASVTGTFVGMALHTVVGLVILSLGLLATQFRDPGRLIDDRWLPVPLAVGTMAGALMLWQALTLDQMRTSRRQAQLVAANLTADALGHLRYALRTLELVKLRWEHLGGRNFQEWQAGTKGFLQEEPVIEAIAKTDASWRVDWVEPKSAEAPLPGADPREDRRWDAAGALKEARESGKMAVSPGLDLSGAGRGFMVCFPLSAGGEFDGVLMGIFRPERLAQMAMMNPVLANCRISLLEDSPQMRGLAEAASAGGAGGGIAAEAGMEFYGHRWRFVVEPDMESMPGRQLPRIVLLLGVLLGLTKAAAMLSFQHFRSRSSKIRTANRQLQKAERELRETLLEKNTAKTLLETAGRMARLGHWELPAAGGDPQWSAVMYEIHDISPDTPITRARVERFVHPEHRELLRQRARKALVTGEAYEMEVRLITGKDRQIWVQMRGEPVRGEDGEIFAIHGIVQDIDERHRAAELLKEQNRQLAIATARAEAHARAKAEFLANMSHEIRTPLNAVIGMSELLMHGQLEAREREFVETIHSSGDMLLSLINDILDFSKIESGQLDLEQIPVPLREMSESVLDLLAGAAARKKLDLMCWIDPGVPERVLGDPTRLRQVLMNLCGNAIKFTARGEVFLKLSVRKHEGESWLRAAVRDTGIGISEEGQKRLFGIFSQVDASTTRRFGGTGLGLAISQRLIRNMGGEVWVESEVDQGSTFHFEIPLKPVNPPETIESPQPDAGLLPGLKGLRVLVVEDNATHRWILENQFESWSMQPTVAEDARQALSLIESGEKYDLAIIDGLMPEVDGHELTAQIRQRRSARELPILILTSMDDPGRDWKSLEVAAVLTKPVRSAVLFSAVRSILLAAPGAEGKKSAALSPDEKPGVSHPLRILVAEDNPVNQRVVALHLQRMGYQHTMAGNGREALDAVAAATIRYDVLLLDVQMPVMDGLEAARELCRRYPAGQRPWMIALTANAQGSDKDECLEAGMNDYLSKPVRGESLQKALRTAFDQINLTA